MHTHAPCFTFAQDHFRLTPSIPPDERIHPARTAPLFSPLLPPAPQLRQNPSRRRDSAFYFGFVPSLFLHLLCFGLLIACTYFNMDAFSELGGGGGGGGNGSGNGIRLSQVVMTSLTGPGPAAAAGPSSQEVLLQETPEEPPLPEAVPKIAEETVVPEKTTVPPVEDTAIPIPKIPPQEPPETARPEAPVEKPAPTRKKEAKKPPRAPAAAARNTAAASAKTANQAAQNPGQPSGAASGPGPAGPISGPGSGGGSGGGAGAGIGPGSGPGSGLAAFGGSHGPSFKRFVKPDYPARARRLGITGRVVLRIRINENGLVDRMEVEKSADDLLVQAAKDAVRRSTFNPLRQDGKAVPCWTLLPVSFTLEDG